LFHERLAKERDKLGLSQAELAKRLGMARTTYSGYENGSREPDLKTLNKLAEFFGVNLNWLVTGNEATLDEDDEKLIDNFSKLSGKDQTYILELIDRLKKE
jgi:transcriptional regulator with XRE-family HTH domain